MEKAKTANRYSAEVRSRAVRMVLEHGADHASQWAAIGSIAAQDRLHRGDVARLGAAGGARPGSAGRTEQRRAGAHQGFGTRGAANSARPTRSYAKRQRILRWRSSTAGPSHDRVHRRSSWLLTGSSRSAGSTDRPEHLPCPCSKACDPCSATRVMAGQRQPDGRSLRATEDGLTDAKRQAKMSSSVAFSDAERRVVGRRLEPRPVRRDDKHARRGRRGLSSDQSVIAYRGDHSTEEPCGFVHNASALHTTPPAHQQQPRLIFIYVERQTPHAEHLKHIAARR